jgi:hypothetical protein
MALTNKYGVNYKAALVTVPPSRIHQGEYGGKQLSLIDTIVLDADAASGDVVKIGRLPAGAKVLSARVFGADLGATGTLKLGNSASMDGSGTDAAVDNSFITAADSSGQAYDVWDGTTAAMRGAAIGVTRFTKEVDVELKFVGATSGATGALITVMLEYIVY